MKPTTVLFVLAAILLAVSGSAQQNRATVGVQGRALVYAKPDRAVMTFGIETRGGLKDAKGEHDAIMKRALATMETHGVRRKDIQTEQVAVHPLDRGRDGESQYRVRSVLIVTLTDLTNANVLVSEALEAGVTTMQGVVFETADVKKYRDQARELALLAAREKAGKMAAVLGQSIGSATQIQESNCGNWPVRYYSSWCWDGWRWGWGGGTNMAQNVVQNLPNGGGEAENPEGVALGKIGIEAQVHVTFELRN